MKTTDVEAGRHTVLVVETILKQNTAMIRQNELILEKLLNTEIRVESAAVRLDALMSKEEMDELGIQLPSKEPE